MSEIYERLIEARAALGVSQRAVADRLHVSKGAVSMIETGTRPLKDRYICQFCNEYGINETWLRTGAGEMFAPKTYEQEIAEITAKIFTDDNEMRRRLVSIVSNLSDDQIDVLQQIANEWLENEKNRGL